MAFTPTLEDHYWDAFRRLLIFAVIGWDEYTSDWIKPFGTIFINLLKLIAVPLVLPP